MKTIHVIPNTLPCLLCGKIERYMTKGHRIIYSKTAGTFGAWTTIPIRVRKIDPRRFVRYCATDKTGRRIEYISHPELVNAEQ